MKLSKLCAIVAIILLTSLASAQKVKVGFDKSTSFTSYHTYSWPKDTVTRETPLRRLAVITEIDYQLKQKGFSRVEDGGDLLLIAYGGMESDIGGESTAFLPPSYSSWTYPSVNVWYGEVTAPANLIVDGGLALQFVDAAQKKVVWQGSVKQKLDPNKRTENLKLVKNAITKLLDKFPPKKS
jgi:hypothetical protein